MMHGTGPGVVRRDGQGKGTRALLACQAQNRTTIPSKVGVENTLLLLHSLFLHKVETGLQLGVE